MTHNNNLREVGRDRIRSSIAIGVNARRPCELWEITMRTISLISQVDKRLQDSTQKVQLTRYIWKELYDHQHKDMQQPQFSASWGHGPVIQSEDMKTATSSDGNHLKLSILEYPRHLLFGLFST